MGRQAEQALHSGGGLVCLCLGARVGDEDGDSLFNEGIWEGLLEEVTFGDGPP